MNSANWGLGSPAGEQGVTAGESSSVGHGTSGDVAVTAPHEYVTEPIRFGRGIFYQSRCSCGWLSPKAFTGEGADSMSHAEHAVHVAEVTV